MKTDKETLKAVMNAPCGYKDERRKVYPTVDCEYNCGNCDWNPREHERRMTTGVWKNGRLHFKRRFN